LLKKIDPTKRPSFRFETFEPRATAATAIFVLPIFWFILTAFKGQRDALACGYFRATLGKFSADLLRQVRRRCDARRQHRYLLTIATLPVIIAAYAFSFPLPTLTHCRCNPVLPPSSYCCRFAFFGNPSAGFRRLTDPFLVTLRPRRCSRHLLANQSSTCLSRFRTYGY